MPKALLLVVDANSTAQSCAEYAPWKESLQVQGYTVIEQVVDGSIMQPPDIRDLIREVYARTDVALEGAILIGGIPAAYAICHTGDYSNQAAQIAWLSLDAVDMFYEDLDGAWDAITPQQIDQLVANPPSYIAEVNLYDTMTVFRDRYLVSINYDYEWDPSATPDKSQYEIEIWVARIMTHNLDVPGESGLSLMSRYFASNIALRSEDALVASVANVLCSGEGYNDQGMDFSALFCHTESQERVTEESYLDVLAQPEGSALTHLTAHSNPAGHAMYDNWLGVDELQGRPKTSAFYLLNACSACRWDWSDLQAAAPAALELPNEPARARNGAANYLGGIYAFDRSDGADNRCLAVVGFTGVGGFNNLYRFTEAYRWGCSYGAMFREWFNFNLAINFGPLDYVILGDPSFTPSDGLAACTSEVHTLGDAGWYMCSVPGQLYALCTSMSGECGDLVCALGDDIDPFYAFRYDADLHSYARVPPANQVCYQPGMGMWIYTWQTDTQIDAEVTTLAESVELALQNGWNQIGNPYTFSIGTGSIKVRCGAEELSLTEAQVQGWVTAILFGYDAGAYVAIDPTTGCVPAWTGCWLRAYRDDCTLIFQPVGCTSSLTQAEALSEAEARALELPPPPPLNPQALDIKEIVAGLSAKNVPNPIRSEHTTVFRVEGAKADLVEEMRVDIYDLSGRLVFTQAIAAKELAWHTVNDAGELLANGVYLYRVWVKIGGIWYPLEVQKLAVVP